MIPLEGVVAATRPTMRHSIFALPGGTQKALAFQPMEHLVESTGANPLARPRFVLLGYSKTVAWAALPDDIKENAF